jgi:RNA recognition motif-containing protein
VARSDINKKEDGTSKGTGIVQYEKSADAKWAVDNFNATQFQGRKVSVRMDRGEGGGGGKAAAADSGGRGGAGGKGDKKAGKGEKKAGKGGKGQRGTFNLVCWAFN